MKVDGNLPELLAPAGSLETFGAALDGGADAVYVGAPGFNARNLARDLKLEEIGAMIGRCHKLDKKLYIAANSLVLEREIPQVIESLAVLEQLGPDGLIVQDIGLMQLIRHFFPSLPIHGSTLAGAHNSDGVNFLADQGCERVVLARELTLKEIATIRARCSETELEIFVHGAMCFSFSGLCLFSSYLGGKSGLRGKCVQPCRRSYKEGVRESGRRRKTGKPGHSGKGGKYLFSMNDLSGLQAVPELVECGISSLKIEGRLRSGNYVHKVISAYRLVLDNVRAGTLQPDTLHQAENLVEQAMGRKTSEGYFFTPQPQESITPYQSGNMGLHLGSFTAVRKVGEKRACRFVTKANLEKGDRLRLHMEPSGERIAFRLKSLMVAGEEREQADAGEKVSFLLPDQFPEDGGNRVSVFKVDGSNVYRPDHELIDSIKLEKNRLQSIEKKANRRAREVQDAVTPMEQDWEVNENVKKTIGKPRKKGKGVRLPVEWWLRLDSPKLLLSNKLPLSPDRYLLRFCRPMLSQAGQIRKWLGSRARGVVWELPPVIFESEMKRVKGQVRQLLRSGFRSFQLSHLSQKEFFKGEKVHLFGGHSLNLMNSLSVRVAIEGGCDGGQVAMELDKEVLGELLQSVQAIPGKGWPTGLTVYGAPALYTSRLAADHFTFDDQIRSPKEEEYIIRKREGYTETVPVKPFSLLPYLEEIRGLGIKYIIVDISEERPGPKSLETLIERLVNSGRYPKLPTFNYLGKID